MFLSTDTNFGYNTPSVTQTSLRTYTVSYVHLECGFLNIYMRENYFE
jgi:hypothetical protein